jgi:hypothetical protein
VAASNSDCKLARNFSREPLRGYGFPVVARIIDGEGPKGTLWHQASRTGEGFGWFESEIIEEVCTCFHCMAILFSY